MPYIDKFQSIQNSNLICWFDCLFCLFCLRFCIILFFGDDVGLFVNLSLHKDNPYDWQGGSSLAPSSEKIFLNHKKDSMLNNSKMLICQEISSFGNPVQTNADTNWAKDAHNLRSLGAVMIILIHSVSDHHDDHDDNHDHHHDHHPAGRGVGCRTAALLPFSLGTHSSESSPQSNSSEENIQR